MKRLIVPIDFSQFSEIAFLTAVAIAEKGDASITCVNVVTASLDWKNISRKDWVNHPEIIELEEEATDKLNAFVKDHQVTSTTVEAVVGVGVPYDVIIDVAHQRNADLIIIGAYGKGYEQGRFIGSNLQKVIRLASCPVLAVKKVLDGPALHKMAYASLFNEASKPAFARMKPFINYLGASVHFLYINLQDRQKDSTAILSQMDRYAAIEEGKAVYKHIHDSRESEKGIIDFCENNKVGWIGIASNTRKLTSSYSIGVTETLIFKTDIPVLSVKFE